MKQTFFNTACWIANGVASIYLFILPLQPVLIEWIAVCISSFLILFARNKREMFFLFVAYSGSLLATRYFVPVTGMDDVLIYLALNGTALVSVLILTQPGFRMNAVRWFFALGWILFAIFQPRNIVNQCLILGVITIINMTFQANRDAAFQFRFWKEHKERRHFKQRVEARNRRTTSLMVRSIQAGYTSENTERELYPSTIRTPMPLV